MALFSRSKETEQKDDQKAVVAEKKATKPSAARATDRDLTGVIVKPRITEKAVGQHGNNVYTFVVRKGATKYDVADAIKALYSVTPVKVNIVNKAPRTFTSRTRGRSVSEKGLKKAYVYLKSGDSISLV